MAHEEGVALSVCTRDRLQAVGYVSDRSRRPRPSLVLGVNRARDSRVQGSCYDSLTFRRPPSGASPLVACA